MGKIKSLISNKILKPIKKKEGYLKVNLYKNKKLNSFYVHRIVGIEFIPNPFNKPEINHIDENKQNNKVENLEWCNRIYNVQYSKFKSIIQYDMDNKLIKKWLGAIEIQRKININQASIIKCCKGKRKSAGGYIWKYEEV